VSWFSWRRFSSRAAWEFQETPSKVFLEDTVLGRPATRSRYINRLCGRPVGGAGNDVQPCVRLRQRESSFAGLSRSGGLTLIEVLIALTLTSLLLLGLMTGLRGISDASIRSGEVADRISDMRLVSDFLYRHLRVTVPLRQQHGAEGESWAGLVGEEDRLQWLAPMQAANAPGDLFIFRLTRVVSGERHELRLAYMPYPETGWEGGWAPLASHRLVDELGEFRIRYQHPESGEWETSWRHHAMMPTRLGIQVQASGRYWPEIIVPLVRL